MKNWITKREEILNVPLPVHSGTYSVIPHSVFLEEITDKLREEGYDILEERYLTGDSGNVISGVIRLGGIDEEYELAPSINVINSYNKKKKALIMASGIVLSCTNGMIAKTENGYYSRKHMGNALEDFRIHIDLVIKGIRNEFERLRVNRDEMRNIELTKKEIAMLIGDMFINHNMINPTQLNIFKNEIEHSESFKGNSLWNFYNWVTEAFKNNHPMNYDKQQIAFHTYATDQFNLTGSRGLFKSII